jgi:hypothetical protein
VALDSVVMNIKAVIRDLASRLRVRKTAGNRGAVVAPTSWERCTARHCEWGPVATDTCPKILISVSGLRCAFCVEWTGLGRQAVADGEECNGILLRTDIATSKPRPFT